jgi:hypothetical protein
MVQFRPGAESPSHLIMTMTPALSPTKPLIIRVAVLARPGMRCISQTRDAAIKGSNSPSPHVALGKWNRPRGCSWYPPHHQSADMKMNPKAKKSDPTHNGVFKEFPTCLPLTALWRVSFFKYLVPHRGQLLISRATRLPCCAKGSPEADVREVVPLDGTNHRHSRFKVSRP